MRLCHGIIKINVAIIICLQISDEGLMRLSGKGKLEHLIIKACQALTDSGKTSKYRNQTMIEMLC